MTESDVFFSAYFIAVAFASAGFVGLISGLVMSVAGTLFRGRRGKFYEGQKRNSI